MNIANAQREDLRQDSIERYKDTLLVDFFKEMSDLLKDSNGSLTSDPIIGILARVKALNIFRQLDSKRATLVLRFLYETRQLTDTNTSTALDISTATVNEVDCSALETLPDIGTLILRGIVLKNCTFGAIKIKDIDFTSTVLTNVNFSSAVLTNVNFSSAAMLSNVQFSSARLTMFSSHLLRSAMFSSHLLGSAMLTSHLLGSAMFSSHLLGSTMFSSHLLRSAMFSSALICSALRCSVLICWAR